MYSLTQDRKVLFFMIREILKKQLYSSLIIKNFSQKTHTNSSYTYFILKSYVSDKYFFRKLINMNFTDMNYNTKTHII
ncbi:hypothetical protein pb186bvf_019443 [Paramecium bursaria]